MSVREAQHNMVIRVTSTELAQVHALAGDVREPIAVVVRRWIRDSYRTRFGDSKPPTPTLKHGSRLRLPR